MCTTANFLILSLEGSQEGEREEGDKDGGHKNDG
jgi:hypothetical protein